MLDRHDLNYVLLNDTDGEYEAIYKQFCRDYPALEKPLNREERNALLKTMVHDFCDCWAVDWWDDLEAFRRFKVAFGVSDAEVANAFSDLYIIARRDGWPQSVEMYSGNDDELLREKEGETKELRNCPLRLTWLKGEPIYGCYAHDACWRILERWLDAAIAEYGDCEPEAKWALYKLVDSSIVEQYPYERDMFLIYVGAVLLYLVGMPILALTVFHGSLVFLILTGVGALCIPSYLIKNVKMFRLVAERRFYVDPEENCEGADEENIPLPEAVVKLREADEFKFSNKKEGER